MNRFVLVYVRLAGALALVPPLALAWRLLFPEAGVEAFRGFQKVADVVPVPVNSLVIAAVCLPPWISRPVFRQRERGVRNAAIAVFLCLLLFILAFWARRTAPVFGVPEYLVLPGVLALAVAAPVMAALTLKPAAMPELPVPQRSYHPPSAGRTDWRTLPQAGSLQHGSAASKPAPRRRARLSAPESIWPLLALVAVGCIVLAWYGSGVAWFVPDAAWEASLKGNARRMSWVVALFAGLLFILILPPGWSIFVRFILAEAVALLMALFLLLALGRGVPAFLSLFETGTPGQAVVVVASRGFDHAGSLGCDGRVRVQGEGAFDAGLITLCGVDEETWSTLAPGTRLTLTGRRTSYGLRYERINR